MSECPPLVSMRTLRELFPQHNDATVWRWRTTRGGRMTLPEPDALDEPGNPVWYFPTIVEWGERTGKNKDWDRDVLERLARG